MYRRRSPLAAYLDRRRFDIPDQVANARDATATVNLSPVSQAAADRVTAAWSAVLPGQAVPMIGERTYGEPDDDR